MPSTVIRSFAYDASTRRLDIEFVTGRRYSYHDVPLRVVAAFRAAASKGIFFNKRMRDQFAFTRSDKAGFGSVSGTAGLSSR